MYRKFLNARSSLRLLEKGLHGGLGTGNLGLVLAGHGVGKGSVLVGVALDELMRGGCVLHVSLDHPVAHVRAHYDTVFEDLASSTHLEDEAAVHADVDRHRRIRVYPPGALTPSKLREAIQLDSEVGLQPSLVILEGLDLASIRRDDLVEWKALAGELDAEFWLSATTAEERVEEVPERLQRLGDLVSVILALEPAEDAVALRALKDHDNPDVTELHVALDPRTLLLIRS
ncbi:MAG: hypothetical protein OEM05_08575 [Myxococcales bacterium]|nr:hypothetical protein [Myxococcales bacterium]